MPNYTLDIPFHGVGLGFREDLREGIFSSKEEIDFLEVITEHCTSKHKLKAFENICNSFQVIPHGLGLSIGSMTPIDPSYLRAIKQVSDLTKSSYYSEHLCVTNVPGIEIGHLSPLWFTEKTLKNTIEKVSYVQDYLGKPLILENVTYFFDIPCGNISQTDFFRLLVDTTGCGVLLDVTNVFVNSVNHQFDPIAFLDQMPLDHVVQVHLAGGYWKNNMFIDGHSELVQEEIWDLLKVLISKCKVKGIIFEHDQNFPEMEALLQQTRRAKRLLKQEDELL